MCQNSGQLVPGVITDDEPYYLGCFDDYDWPNRDFPQEISMDIDPGECFRQAKMMGLSYVGL